MCTVVEHNEVKYSLPSFISQVNNDGVKYYINSNTQDKKLYGSLHDVIKETCEVDKWIDCPINKSKFKVWTGDIISLNLYLKNFCKETYESLQKSENQTGDLTHIFVYGDCYSTRRRFKSDVHLPGKSFSTKKELDDELKKVNPINPNLEESCPKGLDCLVCSRVPCGYNHVGISLCRYEKSPILRCTDRNCRFNHFEGRRNWIIDQKISYLNLQKEKACKVVNKLPGPFPNVDVDTAKKDRKNEAPKKHSNPFVLKDDNNSKSIIGSNESQKSDGSRSSVESINFNKSIIQVSSMNSESSSRMRQMEIIMASKAKKEEAIYNKVSDGIRTPDKVKNYENTTSRTNSIDIPNNSGNKKPHRVKSYDKLNKLDTGMKTPERVKSCDKLNMLDTGMKTPERVKSYDKLNKLDTGIKTPERVKSCDKLNKLDTGMKTPERVKSYDKSNKQDKGNRTPERVKNHDKSNKFDRSKSSKTNAWTNKEESFVDIFNSDKYGHF